LALRSRAGEFINEYDDFGLYLTGVNGNAALWRRLLPVAGRQHTERHHQAGAKQFVLALMDAMQD